MLILLRGIRPPSPVAYVSIDLVVPQLLGNGQLQTQTVLFMSTRSERGISVVVHLVTVIRSRWEGTYDGDVGTKVAGSLGCPGGVDCSCTNANANSLDYSGEYKKFLSDFYIAQV